jgi:hypothetical protein
MTFKQAKKQLKKIAGNEFHALSFELTEYGSGAGFKSECSVYINGMSHFRGETWEEAFMKLKNHMEPKSESELLSMA